MQWAKKQLVKNAVLHQIIIRTFYSLYPHAKTIGFSSSPGNVYTIQVFYWLMQLSA